MGSGASAGSVAEATAAVNAASDDELKAAMASLSEEQRQKVRAALSAGKPEWKDCFVVAGHYACKDIPLLAKVTLADAAIQVKEEPRAPRFAVMGTATNETLPEDAKDNIFWLAQFDDMEAWSGPDHKEREHNKNTFMPTYMSTGASADEGMPGMVKDMVGSYMGPAFHIEKSGSTVSGEQDVFNRLIKIKAKDEDSAEKIMEFIKSDGPAQVNLDGSLRLTAMRQKNMIGPIPHDDLIVQWIHGWKTKEDYTREHKEWLHCTVNGKLSGLVDTVTSYEFAATKNFQK